MTDVVSYPGASRSTDWLDLNARFLRLGPRRSFQILAWSIIALVGASCLLLQLPTYQWFSDYWEHVEAIRSLAASPLHPANPHYATFDSDRFFIPPYVLLGFAVRYLGMSLFAVLGLFGVFNIALIVFALGRFARVYFADLWGPCAALLVLLFAWGQPWVWTGCYNLRALFYNAYYPSAFVLGLTFATWTLVIRALRCDEIATSTLIGIGALTALMFISHQLAAAFAIGGIGLFLLFEPLAALRIRIAIAVAVAGGLALSMLWPYFNPLKLVLAASSVQVPDGHPDFYDPARVLLYLAPSLLGLYGIARMVKRTRRLTLLVGFATVFAVYVGGGVIGNPITHRLLTFFTIFLQLGLVWEILERQKRRAGTDRSNARLLLVGLAWVLLQTGFAAGDFLRVGLEHVAHRSFGSFPNQPVVREMQEIATKLPEDAIVFASYSPALVMPTFKGKTVSRPRAEHLVADGDARFADDRLFFSRRATKQVREDLIAKYHATYVLYRSSDLTRDVADGVSDLGPVVAAVGDIVLIAIKPHSID